MAMNLDDIRYFRKVAETLNVTRASEALGITQPALSYSLKRLENEIGDELIIRKKNGVELSKLGEEFYKRSVNLINEWENIQNLITSEGEDAKGEFSIGIHPSVALYSLDKFLPHLTKEFPLIDFKFVHGLSREMTEKVISWEIDFGIVVNPIKYPDLVIKELCRDEVTLFHKTKCRNKLIFDPKLAQSQDILKRLNAKGLGTEGKINSGNLEVIADLVEQGLGYGVLPSRVAANHKGLKKLAGSPVYHDKICLVYRPEKHKNPISRRILELIKSSKF